MNAIETARERGLSIEDAYSTEKTGYESYIRVVLATDRGDRRVVGGTNLTPTHPRLVRLDDTTVEVPLSHNRTLLVSRSRDVPGVIGALGTTLGEHGVNIAGFQLSNSPVAADDGTTDAVSILTIDAEPSAACMTKIRALPQVKTSDVVNL